MDEHLGYPKHPPFGTNTGNSQIGNSSKIILVDNDQLDISPPRDRNSTFEPQLIPKSKKRFNGFDEKISKLIKCTSERPFKQASCSVD